MIDEVIAGLVIKLIDEGHDAASAAARVMSHPRVKIQDIEDIRSYAADIEVAKAEIEREGF